MTLKHLKEYWASRGAKSVEFGEPLPDEVADHFLKRFNESPPASHYTREQAKHIYLVSFGSHVSVIFHDGSCITMMNFYEVKYIQFWLSSVEIRKPEPAGQEV